jgi:hypothetical protein
MQLAGHGKDDHLIQVEIPIVPSVGDRIREDANSKDCEKKVESLITEGEFIEIVEKYGETFWKAKLKNGKFALMAPEDTVIVERAAVLVEEISKPLPEQITKRKTKPKPSLPKGIKPVLVEGLPTQSSSSKDPRLVQPSIIPFQIGDRIKDKGHFIGVITSINPRCITAKSNKSIKSYNLEELKDPDFIKPCTLHTSTISEALEPLALQPETLEKSPQLPISTSAKTRKKSINSTSQMSVSTQISEITVPQKELTSSLAASPAQEPVSQVQEQDLTTPNHQCGLSTCDASERDSPSLSLSKIPLDYSIAEWELSYKGYPKAGTMRNGRLSPLPCLEVPKKESGFLSLPTLTTGLGSGRNAGATKSEKWLKDNHFVQSTQALNPQIMALLFAFPMDWTECLLESPKESEDAMMLENSLGEQLTLTVQQSPLSESCTYTEFSANNINASSSDRLEFLLEQREKLIASGACPDGVWINCGKVPHRDFKQAVWKSHKPRPEWDNKKSKYIGEFGKEAHISAIAQHRAGQELRKVEREIRKLQVKS